jgi:hypothetical protein
MVICKPAGIWRFNSKIYSHCRVGTHEDDEVILNAQQLSPLSRTLCPYGAYVGTVAFQNMLRSETFIRARQRNP